MTRKLWLPAVVALAALVPALAVAQKVSYDFDKTEDFASLKTFSFREGTPSGNALVDQRVMAAITNELVARGMVRDDEKPDVYVVTHLTFEKSKDLTVYNSPSAYGPYGWYWGGGWGPTDIRVQEILTGTLVIDLADATKGELVWRGIGVKEVQPQPKPSRVDKNVNQAVAKIMKNYPPKKKTS